MRKYLRLFEKAALLCIGILGLVFLFNHDRPPQQIDETPTEVVKATIVRPIRREKQETASLCIRNKTVMGLPKFDEEPQHIKDFLMHKHCREFDLIQNVPGKCGGRNNSHNVFLLLVIKSSPLNYDRREMVRRTWGKERVFQGVQIRTVFITGVAPDQKERKKLNRVLEMENQQHQDILQWNFIDTFFNLTLKQYKLMQWLDDYCPGAQFIFNGDDDVFVHSDNMVEYLQDMNASQHLYVGYLIALVGPIREKWSKYYVSQLVTQNNSYPPYVAGGGILMSRFTAIAIYRAARAIEFLPIDDVFFGKCLEVGGLAPKSHMGFRVNGVKGVTPQDDSFNPCYYRDVLMVHRFQPHEQLLMWEAVHESSLDCARSPQQTA
ncbi:N-acetyllactosaminide beta-1,3-N-acetylglucosaminyltransferase 3-like [Scyliorhinus canicula]|uniref:N-acetyllactosaminide beta-1,3-N-acetylglucosaminyltransferase 3-like n=1 Tax=Scyliorhinus canicula TaxID=7830 RepID=UPI0018F4DD54|nr:N-acetyllactosaminide beta-1,3-N-acetylglucosaminyltransferase 3-like [Scyliorhinus canicula]XP_038633895.1 N-acetyllactosaminide beta-1,3-N-acetylglucosaminyltransferase 3-like [Scyliorhinus canicula]XP_038633896.1 N-acetyllactosaminide beta-1,3-N-acetylglucosaminyltransferase 3-like [Scyliorhinus canicula]